MFEEVNSCIINLIHCKNLCKCHSVPPPITTIFQKKVNKQRKNGRPCGGQSALREGEHTLKKATRRSVTSIIKSAL
jgi:hypothetical protein